ncbi:polysaccharide biosynthesis protein [Sphingomicrobium flavum]|uniref:polysaccharide biosynthesis protein n=1 Tax=Sphingomicrobium flavum TaxID=1229164 RepID=UPI0021AD6654|nr:nucleoside-diphosphate sugar epimerase/dehydratase [Sphingomicrobium flavum]
MTRLRTVTDPILKRLIDLPRSARRGAIMALDMMALVAAAWAGFSIRLGVTEIDLDPFIILCTLAAGCWILAALIVRPYRSTTRYTGRQTIFLLLKACALMGVILTFVLLTTRPEDVPRTLGILQPLLFFCFITTSRVIVAAVLQPLIEDWDGSRPIKRVLVYGSGTAMQQMALAINREPGLKLIGIVDEVDEHVGSLLEGLPVWPDRDLEIALKDGEVDELFLAHAGKGQRATRRALLDRLRKISTPVHVRVLPSMSDVAFDKVSVSDMRQIEIGDLLGRDPVEPDPELISRNITGRDVLVTGAGGSIGSELARQILALNPASLVLVDQSEYHLYAIEDELRGLAANLDSQTRIVPELANIADSGDCSRLFASAKPQTVFHAAAYKHVPLVEQNVVAGVRNNVIGTLNACLEAEKQGTETFILVSTDKAVRPTSVMGASKRVCELVVQARATHGARTRYSAVRFGNVLGSSGSVVPKFREQIEHGGPVTVTDMEMTRFFMTIPEAAQLVIQAGAMAEGGEIFLLDMGDPVKISDLARAMIELSGLEVRDADNPNGDIEITEVGLRPGEKLFEELLIGDNPLPTSHPRIVKGHEDQMGWDELAAALSALADEIAADDDDSVRARLRVLVAEYRPNGD